MENDWLLRGARAPDFLHHKVRIPSKPCHLSGSLVNSASEIGPIGHLRFWHPSCSAKVRRISFSLPCAVNCMRRTRFEMMKKLIRELLVLATLIVFTVGGAFAQGKGRDKRPPKDPGTVKSSDKKRDTPPPPKNDRPKGGKKKP
jgi:hypothetical protein